MTPEAVAASTLARIESVVAGSTQLTMALESIRAIIVSAVSAAVREVQFVAPGVVVEDARADGGAAVEDAR